jgi:excisionase family DNA binding protein
MPDSEVPRWLSINQASAYVGVSAQTIRSIIHRGELRASQLNDRSPYIIDRLDLDRLVERKKRIVPPYRKGTRAWVAKRHAQERAA